MKIHSLAVLLAIITASVDTTGAKEVVNPCNICPNGATAGDDVAPHAEDGDSITCKELIEAAKLFETGTYWCGVYELNEQTCCPPAEQPVDPCTICPNGITVADEIHTDFGCSDLVGTFSLWESESNFCKIGGESYESMCCPTVAESPCVICPDGATAGDDFKPYEDDGFLMTCKMIIESYAHFDAGSDMCYGGEDEALCCPAPIAPETPCNICSGGATAGDDFIPFSSSITCGGLMAQAKLFETSSNNCEYYEGYEVSCCPETSGGIAASSPFGGCAFLAVASALWTVLFV